MTGGASSTGGTMPVVRVVAAVLFDQQGRVLLAERPAGRHLAGWWEFPGGKVGAGESDAVALVRELREELGIEALPERELLTVCHSYSDRAVQLVFWRVGSFAGEPDGLEGQRLKWVSIDALADERLLEADRPLVAALQLARRRADRWQPTAKT